MKKNYSIAIIFSLLFLGGEIFSQNIAINTTGTPAAPTNMFEITQTNPAANMVALYAIHNGATGVGLTGYGLQAIKTGGAGTNIAGYFSASGGANNYPGIFMGGNVGIGTGSPYNALEVHMASSTTYNGTPQFRVSSVTAGHRAEMIFSDNLT